MQPAINRRKSSIHRPAPRPKLTALRIAAGLGGVGLLALGLTMLGPPQNSVAAPAAALPPGLSGAGAWQDAKDKTCTHVFKCAVIFPKIPAGKTVVVTRASCRTSISATTYQIDNSFIASDTNPLYRTYLIPVLLTARSAERIYAINNEVVQVYPPLYIPTITLVMVSIADSIIMHCGIGGTITP